jgi:hypothetical protein
MFFEISFDFYRFLMGVNHNLRKSLKYLSVGKFFRLIILKHYMDTHA